MVSATTGTEYLLAAKVAEEYRRKGYEVARDAALDFLPGFHADLIARKDDEVRVIEVKSRSSLAANPQIGEMARIVDEKRGWTFELRLVGEPHRLDAPKDGQASQVTDVDERIDETKRALAAGLSGAALLLAWSAVEASARRAVVAKGIADERVAAGGNALDQAVFLGIISREDYRRLAEVRRQRNALAHGFDVSDPDEETVSGLIDLARQIEREDDPAAR